MKHTRKQVLCLLLALLAAVSLCQPALAAGVTLMPDVVPEMSDAAYWTEGQEGAQDVILTLEEIEAFNQDTAIREGTMVMDLKSASGTFDGIERNKAVVSSQTDDANYYFGWTYGGDGEALEWSDFEAMIRNCEDPQANDHMPLRYGIAVNRTVLRVFPDPSPILDDPADLDFDYQSLSGVKVNDPLLIYTTSMDRKYYLARSLDCSGWIPVEDVAICADKDEWLSAWDLPSEQLLVFYGNREYTDASNTHPETARRMLTTGTALELVTDLAPGQLVANRSPYHNYVVYLPVRRDDGSYEKQMALIPETAQVSVGYLPLTAENIAMVALNSLGDAYGWGGMLDVEDCSGFIRTVYACFGLEIGRNSTWQWAMNVEKIDMTAMCLEEKRLILDELPLGAALCFNGHEMMYLGKVDDKYYVVSTVSSIVSPYDDTILRTRDVMINTMDVKRGSGKTWLGAINQVYVPCYAKLDGKSYDFPGFQPYHDAVTWCLGQGVLPGLDIDDTFGIGQESVRSDLARALWGLAGSPVQEEDTPEEAASGTDAEAAEPTPTPAPPYPFEDVPEDDALRTAILWVTDNGLMAGSGDAAFSPDGTVTGTEVLTALQKLAGLLDPAGTADEGDVLTWAADAGITADGELPADGAPAREQLAAVLYRFGQYIAP